METVIASSINVEGTIFAARKLTKRSRISARAIKEHATKGQIGQPAACMIEIKALSPPNSIARLWPSVFANRVRLFDTPKAVVINEVLIANRCLLNVLKFRQIANALENLSAWAGPADDCTHCQEASFLDCPCDRPSLNLPNQK